MALARRRGWTATEQSAACSGNGRSGHEALLWWRRNVLGCLVCRGPSVAPHDALDDALNLAELHADGLELGVGGLEADVIRLLEETLEGG